MTSPNLDIDMMRLFKALCDCGSLSLAAKELNVSIPAASRLLAKLRQVFGEDLFLRGAHGMTPTTRAMEIYVPIAGMLASYGKLFVCAVPEPGSIAKTIRIGARSELDFTYLDTALAHVLAKAPNLSLELSAFGEDLEAALRSNRIDLAFGTRDALGALGADGANGADGADETSVDVIGRDALVHVTGCAHPLAEEARVRVLAESDLRGCRRVCVAGVTEVTEVTDAKDVKDEEKREAPGGEGSAEEGPALACANLSTALAMLGANVLRATLPFSWARRLMLEGRAAILGRVEGSVIEPVFVRCRPRVSDPVLNWFASEVRRTFRSEVARLDAWPEVRKDAAPEAKSDVEAGVV